MSNKILILMVAFLFVIMIGLAGGLFMIWSKMSSAQAQVDVAAGTNGSGQQVQQTPGTLFPLETFIVNLADEGGKRYLRVTMDLELSAGVIENDVQQRLPQIRDSILMVLPSKHFADIRTIEGKTGLRNEILANLNGIFGKESITNLYFTEFVIQ
jgi:flagellar FliL protein